MAWWAEYWRWVGLSGVGLFALAQLAVRANLSLLSAVLFFIGAGCEFAALVLMLRDRAETKALRAAPDRRDSYNEELEPPAFSERHD